MPARGLSPSTHGRGAPRGEQALARLRSLSLGGAALGLVARARRAALVVVGSCSIEGRCAGERRLSFGARPWCDMPAASSSAKLAAACQASASVRMRSRSLRRRRSTRACCCCARRAPLVVVVPCSIEWRRASERPLYFDARPWCDVPASASNAKPAAACQASAGAPALAVSGEEEAKHSRLC